MSVMLNSDDSPAAVSNPVVRKSREVSRGSKIYFILCQATGRVKCGLGADPRARLAALQVGSPTTLRLIAEIDGDGSKEKSIHLRLGRWHIHGEWFHYVPGVCDVIADEVASHLKDLYHGLYSARTKLNSHLPPSSAVIHDRPDNQRIHRFLSECAENSQGARTQSSVLYRAFEAWCQSSGASACTQKAFTMAMGRAGYSRMLSNVVFFLDIHLKDARNS